GVVPSKRWEAVRDGIEDFSMLTVLKKAADAAAAQGKEPKAVSEARELLGQEASSIAEFCLPEEISYVPGLDGLSVFRPVADKQWEQIQSTRRKIAKLLSTLSQN
ncbi:MAG: hypothetical protein ABIH23_10880, partial [bacterium]